MAEYRVYNMKDPKTGQEEPQVSSKEEFDILKQKLKPDQIKNPRTGQQGDAETIVKEGEFPEEGKADAINVAKEVAKVLKDALREHGDEMQGIFLKDLTTKGVTVKVVYKPDEQGQQTEDEFVFRWDNGSIRLDNVANPVDLGQIQNRSGRSTIQKDLLKDRLLNYLKSYDSASAESSDPAEIPNGQPVDEGNLWESEECQKTFCDAVEMYRRAKDKESVKSLFKACRPFKKGNTIQEKLKGAVDWYNWFTENPPKNTHKQVFLEGNVPGVITGLHKISEGLDILKEYINSTEDLHLGSYYRTLRAAFDNLLIFCKEKFNAKEKLDELISDEMYEEEFTPNYNFTGEEGNVPEDEEAVPVNEMDDLGPEVGDEVDYEGTRYKLYGYCGNEVVLQNVDDERDFKVVQPVDVGIGSKKVDMNEVDYVDPENLPEDNDSLGI